MKPADSVVSCSGFWWSCELCVTCSEKGCDSDVELYYGVHETDGTVLLTVELLFSARLLEQLLRSMKG